MLRHVSEFVNNSTYPSLDITIGKHSYGNPRILFGGEPGVSLSIGSFCSLAEGIKIFSGRFGRHRVDMPTTYPIGMLFPEEWQRAGPMPPSNAPSTAFQDRGDVEIGNDVWVGRDSTILAGVKIGDGAVIGASSLVTKDVKPYEIVGGLPARRIRSRFESARVEMLLQLKWWELPDNILHENIRVFKTNDIDEFISSIKSIRENLLHTH